MAYEIKVESISYQSVVELHTLAILSSLKVFEENLYLNLILVCFKIAKNWVKKGEAAGLLLFSL